MYKELTVGELRKALECVPDNVPVRLSSDTGVDQGCGEIVVLAASYVCYPKINMHYFSIYANDMIGEEDEIC